MRLILFSFFVIFFVVSYFLGAWLADRVSKDLTPEGAEPVNGWFFSENIGASDASSLVRARVARTGTLALAPSEAVYFFTDVDGQGNPINGACTYSISGSDVDTRWWSIAIYGDDFLYIPNEENRSSFNSENIARKSDEPWRITLAPDKASPNWLPTPGVKRVEVLYRLYRPSKELRSKFPNIPLPMIEKTSC